MAQNNFILNRENHNMNTNYGNNKRGFEEFKSNNYNLNDMNMNRGGVNNYTPISLNSQNNFNNNNLNYGTNQIGPNQNNGYNTNSFRPTPCGERIRQAAASNFL